MTGMTTLADWLANRPHSSSECARCATGEHCPHLDSLIAIALPATADPPPLHPTNRDLNQLEGP